MTSIRLTYGNSALAWGRDQAQSAKVLATESERAAGRLVESPDEPARLSNPRTAAGTAAPAPAPAPPSPSTSANRFARLLADIANANVDTGDLEAAESPESSVSKSASPDTDTHLSVALRAATDRARYAAATAPRNASSPLTTMAYEILATQREDIAVERRSQLEDRARRIALTAPRRTKLAYATAYDQLGVGMRPALDRKG